MSEKINVLIKQKKEEEAKKKNQFRSFIGTEFEFDIMGGRQFTLLFNLGLREDAKLLDFGCGSLRFGRLAINYLNEGNYFGIEPNKWLVKEGIKKVIGKEIVKMKKPNFRHNNDFKSSVFGNKFNFIIAQSIFSHTTFPLFKKAIKNLSDSLDKNGILCFTALTDMISNPDRIEENNNEEWIYPQNIVFKYEDLIDYTNKIGHCVYISGYHSNQCWFVYSLNKDLIEIVRNNFDNLTDLSHRYPILWNYSSLSFRIKKKELISI